MSSSAAGGGLSRPASGRPGEPRRLRDFDFRRPSKFGREHLRSLEIAHEMFTRRFANSLGSSLRAFVQLEAVSLEQVSYDDYIRSLPTPTVLATIGLDPLPGVAVLELNVQLALQLVDRLLGGKGTALQLRRPTELETFLLGDLLRHAGAALGETVGTLMEVTAEVGAIEYNPQVVQVAAPSDMVLLLSYRMTVGHGARSEGLLSLCYPAALLSPLMEQLATHLWAHEPGADGSGAAAGPLAALLPDVSVTLRARLAGSAVPARDLAGLRVGDVVRLDHRVGQPVAGHVDGADVLRGHIGRRGRRLALQVTGVIPPPTAAPHPAAVGSQGI